MSNFVTIDEDKFEKKVTYTATTKLGLDVDLFAFHKYLKLRRVVIMPSSDVLVIDIHYLGTNGASFLGMRNGKLIVLADNETIVLPAHENYFYRNDLGKPNESCFYELSKEDFLKICNSSSVSAKLYTGSENFEIKNSNAFAVYCKLFYNAVYDNTAYADVVQNALAEFENAGDSSSSTFSEIAIDGSGVKSSSGCLGMLALLIGMTGAAIGGLCAIV